MLSIYYQIKWGLKMKEQNETPEREYSPEKIKELIVELVKKEEGNITSRRKIFEKLKVECDVKQIFYPSEATLYRFFGKMIEIGTIIEIGKDEYSVPENGKPFSLDEKIIRCTFNKRIYYRIDDSKYGQLIAQIINDYYIDFKNDFHCFFDGELLTCHFSKMFTANEIRDEIEYILKTYTIYKKE